ncbi:MAG: nucleoside deaminase [Myxococcales bacterium]|nr:nucleoside deaminase [Myxococcales bacterium]
MNKTKTDGSRCEFQDEQGLALALDLAKRAAAQGDVPVGAVIVSQHGEVIGEGFNQREATQNPLAHAELLAIHDASTKLGNWRLESCTLYVTLEPCVMCAGAIVAARLKRLVYGAVDEKAGGVQSLYAICQDPRQNHRVICTKEVLGDQCAELMSTFFANVRMQRREKQNE